jgi:hypothetical protein
MRFSHVGIAAAAVLAFAQARAADPYEQAARDPATGMAAEGATPCPATDAQQRQSSRATAHEERASTGSGGGDDARNDVQRSEPRDGVTVGLPDDDPVIQKLLSQ